MYEQIASNRRRTVLLMLVFFVLLVTLGYLLSLYFESWAILAGAVVISVGMSWWSYFRGDRTILAVSRARPIQPDQNLQHRQLQHVVENLCIASGLPQPRVFVIDDPAPNAFATGRNPRHASIAVTSGLLNLLDKTELEGVVAHELSHIKNYDILLATITVTLLGIIVILADWSVRFRVGHNQSSSEGRSGAVLVIIGLLLAILAPIFARLIYFAISRRREYLADASGALLTRYPEGLAQALTKISANSQRLRFANRATASLYINDPFTMAGQKVAGLFATHPPIEKRVEALNNMNV